MVQSDLHIQVCKFEREFTVIVQFACVKGVLLNTEPISWVNLKKLNSKMILWAYMNSVRKLPSTNFANAV